MNTPKDLTSSFHRIPFFLAADAVEEPPTREKRGSEELRRPRTLRQLGQELLSVTGKAHFGLELRLCFDRVGNQTVLFCLLQNATRSLSVASMADE